MVKKSAEQKLKELEERLTELKEEERRLKKAAKAEEKRNREKRYKETGELAEKYFDIAHISLEDRELLFESIAEYINERALENFPKEINSEENNTSEDKLQQSVQLNKEFVTQN